MSHSIARVLDSIIRFSAAGNYGHAPRIFLGARAPWHVDTGLVVGGAITENSAGATNTRVALLSARTLAPVDVLRAQGSSYLFRSVADAVDGYYVLGLDLDGHYKPVCEGPVFPVAS